VVSRLAAQHGLVVRLRSTVAGEPSSGTTAGVYVPAELLGGTGEPDQFGEPDYAMPADAHAGIATALALDEDHADPWADEEHGEFWGADDGLAAEPEYLNGHSEVPVSLLPQRDPGASGISDIPASLAAPAPQPQRPDDEWPDDSMPAQTPEHLAPVSDEWGAPRVSERPSDTSGFFAARAQAVGNGVPGPAPAVDPQEEHDEPASPVEDAQPEPARRAVSAESSTAGSDDAIYQKMLSEWLVDPSDIAKSDDLNWESVWDNGWSAAEAAEEAPVLERTDEGLPVRDPGARLVPGAADSAGPEGGHQRNRGAHRSSDSDEEVASAAEFDAGGQRAPAGGGAAPQRDPDAVRASISSHFGGVHAGRSDARDARGTDSQ
jgi:hypothetical protein